jgi:transcriptional regulator of heat shock response
MNPRTAEILLAAIREFIETGNPVSSGELYGKYRFEVKPATIRNELAELDAEGYLAQPHTSAGRIPTDRGYHFFVEHILEGLDAISERNMRRDVGAMRNEISRGALDDMVVDLAEALGMLGVGYEAEEEKVSKHGLDDLVQELISEGEIREMNEITEIIKDFEALDERLKNFANSVKRSRAPNVFIGRSPITKSPHLSVIADSLRVPGGEMIVIAAVGPKRMDYESNLKFFTDLRRAVEQ